MTLLGLETASFSVPDSLLYIWHPCQLVVAATAAAAASTATVYVDWSICIPMSCAELCSNMSILKDPSHPQGSATLQGLFSSINNQDKPTRPACRPAWPWQSPQLRVPFSSPSSGVKLTVRTNQHICFPVVSSPPWSLDLVHLSPPSFRCENSVKSLGSLIVTSWMRSVIS